MLGFCGRPAAVCVVPDLAAVCIGPKREEEPCFYVHRLELVVNPSLKIIKHNSSRGCIFPPEVNHVYMVFFVCLVICLCFC